jgi:Arc/MetJ-type ribon-helix-helix transcriptional regulator
MATITISPENRRYLESQVEAGRYPTFDAALDAAVDRLRWEEGLRAAAEEGYGQLERGDYTEYDEDGLSARFEQLKERVRQRVREKLSAE